MLTDGCMNGRKTGSLYGAMPEVGATKNDRAASPESLLSHFKP